MDRASIAIQDFREQDLEDLNEYLVKLLPFSVNMIASARDHMERCRILMARERNSIVGVLVEFHSNYNRHIWLDPIIWITGNSRVASLLIKERGFLPAIVISQSNFSRGMPSEKHNIHVFEEYIMVAKLDHIPEDIKLIKGEIRRLGYKDIMDSLHISGFKPEDIDHDILSMEDRFLKERICLGMFADGRLVSRGTIMSTTEEYASVGAFLTANDARRMGYGSDIVLQTMRMASAYSRNACLFARTTNYNAISLYRKLGFEIKEKVYFTDMGTGSMP